MRISVRISIPQLKVNPDAYKSGVRKAVAKWASNVANEMQSYPPQMSHVTYRRTGTYGSGWRISKTDTRAKVSNDVDYATYVGGPRQVDWAAERGWANLEEVAEAHGEVFREEVRQAAQDALS